MACNFIKKKPQHRCFPVNIAKFLRTAFFFWLLLFYDVIIVNSVRHCKGFWKITILKILDNFENAFFIEYNYDEVKMDSKDISFLLFFPKNFRIAICLKYL